MSNIKQAEALGTIYKILEVTTSLGKQTGGLKAVKRHPLAYLSRYFREHRKVATTVDMIVMERLMAHVEAKPKAFNQEEESAFLMSYYKCEFERF